MAKVVGKLKDGREIRGYDFVPTVKAVAEDEIEMIGSTSDKDREGEVIRQDGWDLKNFKKNPVILPSHDYRQPAIGKATKVNLKDGKLTFRIKFPPEGDNPLADVYRKLYKGGFMSASSVGFVPIEWTDGDGKKTPWRTYNKVELLELSLVSVPCNPAALATEKGIVNAVKKGVLTSKDLDVLKGLFKKKEGEENGNDNAEHSVTDSGGNSEQPESEQEGNNGETTTATAGNETGKTPQEEQGDSIGTENEGNVIPPHNIDEAPQVMNCTVTTTDGTSFTGTWFPYTTGAENTNNFKYIDDQRIEELEREVKELKAKIEELTSKPKHYLDIPNQGEAKTDSNCLQIAKEVFADIKF